MIAKIWQIVVRRWVLGLLLVTLLGALAWWIGPLVAIADWRPLASVLARVVVLLLLMLAWGLDNLRVRTAERRAGATLVQALAAGPAASERSAPDNAAEQAILQEKLRDALATLQGARLSRGRKLYQIPWYIIIGAPGSGKTTALKNAGLEFPLADRVGSDAVQGTGGTRYCDWWFSDQAVLIDTAGRYTTHDNVRDGSGQAWLGFLAALKRGRPRRPLNGVVVTINIADLIEHTPTQLALQTKAIKRRIQELSQQLELELPVYLLFTKCDLIAGFSDYFAELEAKDRHQPWGVALPTGRPGEGAPALAEFGERYRALLQRANDRVPLRLQQESDPERRELLFQFPRQMLGLEERLEGVVNAIFQPNQFEQPGWLRGVYFVSAEQPPAVRRWVSGVLPVALCSRPLAAAAEATRVFFLEGLFARLIFAEAELAHSNRRARRRYRWSFSALLAVIAMAFSATVSTLYASQRSQLVHLSQVGVDVEQLATTVAADGDAPLEPAQLDRLRRLVPEFSPMDKPGLTARVTGLEQQTKIGAQARQVYFATLEQRLVPAVAARLAMALERASDDEQRYEALRFYLMLHQREHRDLDALLAWADLLWSDTWPGLGGEPYRKGLALHLRTALEAGLLPPPLNAALVDKARAQLALTPPAQRVYRRLRRELAAAHPGQFSVQRVLGLKAAAIFQRRSGAPLDQGVPDVFSYKVFHSTVLPATLGAAKQLEAERWVYGSADQPQVEADSLGETITELYLTDYVAGWRSYLEDLVIRRFGSAGEGREVVQLLAARDMPLVNLLLAIREHTALDELPSASSDVVKVAGALTQNTMPNQRRRIAGALPTGLLDRTRLPGGAVSAAFAELNAFAENNEALPLLDLQAALHGLRTHLDELTAGIGNGGSQQRGNPEVLRALQVALASAPIEVRQWFDFVAHDTRQVGARSAVADARDAWRDDVLEFYERAIYGRYPLDPRSRRDIRIEDFTRFFGPGGILSRYFAAHVRPFADVSGPEWRWKHAGGRSAATLELFHRLQRIEQSWFDESGEPQLSFELRPELLDASVTRAQLELSGSRLEYGHGPVRGVLVRWPAPAAASARLVLNLANGGTPLSVAEEGEWAWFRLLDRHASLVIEPETGSVAVAFNVQGVRATYALQPRRATHPFGDDPLRDLALPERL